jgi:hypothetical protein
VTSIWYDGSLKGSRGAPISGEVSAGIDMKVSYTMTNLTHIWDTGKGPWNFASAIGIPLHTPTSTRHHRPARAHPRHQRFRHPVRRRADHPDCRRLPLRRAESHRVVPADLRADRRLQRQSPGQPGQNNYTFMPTVAFTHLDGKGASSPCPVAWSSIPKTPPPITATATSSPSKPCGLTASAVAGAQASRPVISSKSPTTRARPPTASMASVAAPSAPGRWWPGRQIRRRPGQHQCALGAGVRHQEPP